MISIEQLTDIGVSRDSNQDNFIYLKCRLDGEDILIASVCDGMGGLDSGEYASRTLCENIRKEVSNKEFDNIVELNRAITYAIKAGNKEIYQNKTQYGKRSGTTVSCVVLTEEKGYAWHAGDSRITKITEKGLQHLTTDHTLVTRMVNEGKITPKEAKTHPKRNVLLNAVGVFKEVSIDMFEFDYKDSLIVLSTDGFWHFVKKSEYGKLLRNEITLQELLQLIISRGELDNITALALRS